MLLPEKIRASGNIDNKIVSIQLQNVVDIKQVFSYINSWEKAVIFANFSGDIIRSSEEFNMKSFKEDQKQLLSTLSYLREKLKIQEAAEAEVRKSEEKFKALVKTSPDAVTVTDISGKITEVSQQTLKLHGFSHEKELIGKKFFDLIDPESKAQAIIYLHKTLKEGITQNLEYTLLKKDGKRFTGEINTSVIKDSYGNPEKFIAITRDITERKKADSQLKKSIREKELLLQEIHHRVKNNLQIISSLLDMSRLRINDKNANDIINNACTKIQSMAFIHSQLYKSERFDRIEMRTHIKELVSYLSEVYGGKKRISPYIEISDVYLSLTQAIPCALVLNELISNAFKHAFKNNREGIIEISMLEGSGRINIYVRDNGVGISNNIDIYDTGSLGLKLVKNLVEKQLKGVIKVKQNKYTEFSVEFPLMEEEAKHE